MRLNVTAKLSRLLQTPHNLKQHEEHKHKNNKNDVIVFLRKNKKIHKQINKIK
jgi:hypothetical protein